MLLKSEDGGEAPFPVLWFLSTPLHHITCSYSAEEAASDDLTGNQIGPDGLEHKSKDLGQPDVMLLLSTSHVCPCG